jgi:hypothetical protein
MSVVKKRVSRKERNTREDKRQQEEKRREGNTFSSSILVRMSLSSLSQSSLFKQEVSLSLFIHNVIGILHFS